MLDCLTENQFGWNLFAHFHTTMETGTIPSHFSKKISASLVELYFSKIAWNIDQKLCAHRIIVIDISAQTNLFRGWFVCNRSALFDYKWNVFSFSIFSEFNSSLMSTFRKNRITLIILIMNNFALTHLISKIIHWNRTNQQIGSLIYSSWFFFIYSSWHVKQFYWLNGMRFGFIYISWNEYKSNLSSFRLL